MRISVAICTHNRAGILAETLNSFQALNLSEPADVELLIVDNKSSDETRDVVHRFMPGSRIASRYIFEENLGLSNARNRAIREATGEVIAFVDDDVYFDRNWLIEILRAFRQFPDAMCLSGAVLPHYENGRPEWLDPDPDWLNMEAMFSITLFGDSARYLEPHETPVGANFALRVEALRALGGFSGALGRHGKVLLSKEESELFFRINRSGQRGASAPLAIVHHRISPERATQRWLLRRFYWQGISQVVFEQLTAPKNRLDLLMSCVRDVRRMVAVLLGGSWSPIRLYWHVRSYHFYHRAFAAYTLAVIRKRVSLALLGGR